MCVTCGCGEPNENHGNPDNLTEDMIDGLVQGSGLSQDEIVKGLTAETYENAAAAGGVTVDEARANVAEFYDMASGGGPSVDEDAPVEGPVDTNTGDLDQEPDRDVPENF